jgi:hypothetical protein
MSDLVALTLLPILAVLAVKLLSTSTGEEVEAPVAVSGLVAAPPRPSPTAIGVDPELTTIQSRHDREVGHNEPEEVRSGCGELEKARSNGD